VHKNWLKAKSNYTSWQNWQADGSTRLDILWTARTTVSRGGERKSNDIVEKCRKRQQHQFITPTLHVMRHCTIRAVGVTATTAVKPLTWSFPAMRRWWRHDSRRHVITFNFLLHATTISKHGKKQYECTRLRCVWQMQHESTFWRCNASATKLCSPASLDAAILGYSYRKSVCLSVRPSVTLIHAKTVQDIKYGL